MKKKLVFCGDVVYRRPLAYREKKIKNISKMDAIMEKKNVKQIYNNVNVRVT
jgi:hypothetical protein